MKDLLLILTAIALAACGSSYSSGDDSSQSGDTALSTISDLPAATAPVVSSSPDGVELRIVLK